MGLKKLGMQTLLGLELTLAACGLAYAQPANYPTLKEGDYNPQGLEKITATVFAINSVDDERNPPELGVMEREIKRIKNADYYLISASPDTAGHGTTGQAKWWKAELAKVLTSAPIRR